MPIYSKYDLIKVMKNYKQIILIFLSLCSFVFCGWYTYEYNFGRYKISAPMEDFEYKKAIIEDSGNVFYKLENLRSIAGPNEFIRFVLENNDRPQTYTPSLENRKNGTYRANFHIHTTDSDGQKTVEERLDEAQVYAENYIKDGYMYIALTDHNTVLGAKHIIKVLQKYPNRYKNLKIVPGLEVSFLYNNSKYSQQPINMHVLALCINPYDKFLNKTFYKKDLKDKWNERVAYFDFKSYMPVLAKYAILGVAHPARYVGHLGKDVYPYIEEMLDTYKYCHSRLLFVEGYYQSYKDNEKAAIYGDFNKFSNFINTEAQQRGIVLTGSTDAHGPSIFRR